MNFTKELPTRPGLFRWRESEDGFHSLADVYLAESGRLACIMDGRVGLLADIGGEWCRLVPAEEIERTWNEAHTKRALADRVWAWVHSRARRVMLEGLE